MLCFFLLKFINDLPSYTENLFTDLYVDDTTIYQISNSQHFIEQYLQELRNFLNTAIGIINFAKHFQNFIDDIMI